MQCLFCAIAAGDVAADIVYQDDQVVAFRDIDPKAPTHILVIPREHIPTLNDLSAAQAGVIGSLTAVAAQLAAAEGLASDGYRVVMNCNWHGGQTVFHIHLHLLGGRQLNWPPG